MKNRFLAVFFTVLVSIICFSAFASAGIDITEEDVKNMERVESLNECRAMGDANLDGAVSSSDARMVLRAATKLENIVLPAAFEKADINKDGVLSSSDARDILRVSVGLASYPDHHVISIMIKEPTCTEEGLKIKYCTVCHKLYTEPERTTPNGSHDFGKWITEKEATCKEEGLKYRECKDCGERQEQSIPKKHNFGEWDLGESPDCTKGIIKTRTCKTCGYKQTIEEFPTEHSYPVLNFGWTVQTPATCTEGGKEIKQCTYCGKITAERDTEPSGHNWIEIIDIVPTCEKQGHKIIKCKNCGEVKEETVLPAKPHNYDEDARRVIKPASCTTEGLEEVPCRTCGKTIKRVIPVLPHSVDSWEIITEPTCNTKGSKTGWCSTCKRDVTVEIPTLPHTKGEVKTENRTEATCTKEGSYETVTYCAVCKAEMSRVKTVIPVKPHTPGEKIVVPATCTEAKHYEIRCKDCNELLRTEIFSADEKPLGHDEGGKWQVKKAPTCTEEGEKILRCLRCNEIIKTEKLPATGHKFGNFKIITEPTCTGTTITKGVYGSSCEVCGTPGEQTEYVRLEIKIHGSTDIAYSFIADETDLSAGGTVTFTLENADSAYVSYTYGEGITKEVIGQGNYYVFNMPDADEAAETETVTIEVFA